MYPRLRSFATVSASTVRVPGSTLIGARSARADSTSRRRSARRLFVSVGSCGRSYSSGIGRSMYFSLLWMMPVSGAHPRFSEAESDSK